MNEPQPYKPKRLTIIGTRGIPGQHGGFETFAQELAIRLVSDHGWQVMVIGDVDQLGAMKGLNEYRGVTIIYSRWSKRRQPMRFYFESVSMAAKMNGLILACGCGVALGALLARWKGVRILVNPDGLEWKRRKWSKLGRIALRILTYVSIHSATALVCDSLAIREHLGRGRLRKRAFVAEYGADLASERAISDLNEIPALSGLDLKSFEYYLVVARLEPENNIAEIVEAHGLSQTSLPLVIIGGVDENRYVRTLQLQAPSNVHFIGAVYDRDQLSLVRTHCRAYLHGHTVGGTNPSLLEAMAASNICICHDNEFNTETTAGHALFFAETQKLAEIFTLMESEYEFERLRVLGDRARIRIRDLYTWNAITNRYLAAIDAFYNGTSKASVQE